MCLREMGVEQKINRKQKLYGTSPVTELLSLLKSTEIFRLRQANNFSCRTSQLLIQQGSCAINNYTTSPYSVTKAFPDQKKYSNGGKTFLLSEHLLLYNYYWPR
uniref:Uncharacterized protein n=1 Tax=Sphaerodactylus townsendi TaxID=933632 RepID=A0ACB8GDS0_9SAUR